VSAHASHVRGTTDRSQTRDRLMKAILTFYLGTAAVEFKQYAAYMQRRTAVRAAQLSGPPSN